MYVAVHSYMIRAIWHNRWLPYSKSKCTISILLFFCALMGQRVFWTCRYHFAPCFPADSCSCDGFWTNALGDESKNLSHFSSDCVWRRLNEKETKRGRVRWRCGATHGRQPRVIAVAHQIAYLLSVWWVCVRVREDRVLCTRWCCCNEKKPRNDGFLVEGVALCLLCVPPPSPLQGRKKKKRRMTMAWPWVRETWGDWFAIISSARRKEGAQATKRKNRRQGENLCERGGCSLWSATHATSQERRKKNVKNPAGGMCRIRISL